MRTATCMMAGFGLAVLLCGSSAGQSKKLASRPAAQPLVVVNGQPISEADLQRMMTTRQVPAEVREKYRRPFLEEMVDARLMRQFLAGKKISASHQELDRQVQQVQDLA